VPDSTHFLTDMRIELCQAAIRPVYRVASDTRRVPTRQGILSDIGVVDGNYILESLAFEPRIEEVLEVQVAENPGHRTGVDVLLVVRPAGSGGPVRIGPFILELET
jgi:hypothetical protein